MHSSLFPSSPAPSPKVPREPLYYREHESLEPTPQVQAAGLNFYLHLCVDPGVGTPGQQRAHPAGQRPRRHLKVPSSLALIIKAATVLPARCQALPISPYTSQVRQPLSS